MSLSIVIQFVCLIWVKFEIKFYVFIHFSKKKIINETHKIWKEQKLGECNIEIFV